MPHCAQMDMFKIQTEAGQSPDVVLEVEGRLPSWNDILGMEEWARYKFKGELQAGFLCALRASAVDYSTRTTSARSIMSTAADTLVSYQVMAQERRRLRSAKKKLAAKNASLSELKFSTSQIQPVNKRGKKLPF